MDWNSNLDNEKNSLIHYNIHRIFDQCHYSKIVDQSCSIQKIEHFHFSEFRLTNQLVFKCVLSENGMKGQGHSGIPRPIHEEEKKIDLKV